MKTKVVTDSGSGLTQKQADALGIGFLPLQVLVDDQQYLDGVDLNTEMLYAMLEDGKMPTTSQPPLLLEEELFEELLKEGYTDIIAINLSSGLSSTNEIVQATAKRLGLTVHTLDIYTTLAIQKYLAIAAKQLLDQGKDPDEIIRLLSEAVDKSEGYLIVDNLDHLAAGGRLTPLAAKLGGLLKIKPVLKVAKSTEGKVDSFDKVRTFHKAVAKGVDQVKSALQPGVDYEFFILNGNDDAMAQKTRELLNAISPDTPVHTMDMFPVIASHTGLGSIGIQFIPKIEGVDYDETRICN
ncbi:DegV family protein [Allobaculum sp. JKK-2023]|uniref:DegV family protein n=1 Tax=Allobaculum sp. JKK-2023 TaxID=3108943 RepID=UPI002B05AAC2|nr:DegV family protein [Allobaculum sp. JKK-2023]